MKGLNFIYCMKLVKNIRCLILINLKVFLEKTYLIKPRKTHRKQYILKSGDGWTCRPVTCNVSRNKDLNVFNECFSEYWNNHFTLTFTAQKMKFSNKDFFSKCDQIRRNGWTHAILNGKLHFCAYLRVVGLFSSLNPVEKSKIQYFQPTRFFHFSGQMIKWNLNIANTNRIKNCWL